MGLLSLLWANMGPNSSPNPNPTITVTDTVCLVAQSLTMFLRVLTTHKVSVWFP